DAVHLLNRPHCDIEHMHALISDLAVAVVPEETPVVMEAVGIERALRRGAQPDVVVDARRRIAIRRTPDGRAHLVDPGLDLANLAELAGRNVIDGIAEMLAAAPLCADLEHAIVFARGVANQMSLLNCL